jgi:hypothetical protein
MDLYYCPLDAPHYQVASINKSLAVDAWINSQSNKAKRTKAVNKYGNIAEWDTSSVTDMSNLFRDDQSFDDDISMWDVSNDTNMSGMFCVLRCSTRTLAVGMYLM